MPRRRQHNPLLGRIVGISVAAHLLALPVLAKFGAFKKIQQQFLETRLVNLPPPPPEKKQPEVKKPPQAHKPTPTAHKGKSAPSPARQAAQKSNLNQPKVVASAGGGNSGDESGPTVDANGTGTAGQLPTVNTDTKPPTSTTPEPQPKVETKPAPPVDVKPQTKIETKPAPPIDIKPQPVPVAPKEPVFTEATAISTPQPVIPDDLRADALDKTCVVEFTIGPDGLPTSVKITQSTGSDELDRLALETAKKWRFKPATRDVQPVESKVRLHIEFQVS